MSYQNTMKPDLLSVIEKFSGENAEYGKAIRCPFHKEHDPSLHIYQDQHWYCFGCNKAGDAYDFLGYIQYGDSWDSKNPEMFRSVMRSINNASCKSVYYDRYEPQQETNDMPKESYAMLRWASAQYHQALLSTTDKDAAAAREYLYSRGYSDRIIRYLKIGFASKNMLLRRGLSLPKDVKILYESQLETLGLLKEGREYYYKRIMFPNVTKDGDVTNLTGRAVGNSSKRYLNIPNLKKQLYLIGLANPSIPLILTESVTDTVSLWQLGFQAVAVNGTALSKRMAASLVEYRDIIVVPQNDAASAEAARKWCDMIPRCKVAFPDYIQGKQKDINDILKQEGEKRATAKINIALRSPMSCEDYLQQMLRNVG